MIKMIGQMTEKTIPAVLIPVLLFDSSEFEVGDL
jgi:hypothetical protein